MSKAITFPNVMPSIMIASLLALALMPTLSSAQVQVNTSASGTVDAVVDADNEEATTSSESILELDIDANADVDANNDEKASSSMDTDNEAELMLNDSGVAVSVASEVNSEADLEVFKNNVAARSDGVAKVDFESNDNEENEVEVDYKHSGTLFGFMPVTVTSKNTVTTYADGTVEIESDLPWWSIMVTNLNYAEAEIKSSIQENSTVMASAGADLSARGKAQVAEAIIAELDAHTAMYTSVNN